MFNIIYIYHFIQYYIYPFIFFSLLFLLPAFPDSPLRLSCLMSSLFSCFISFVLLNCWCSIGSLMVWWLFTTVFQGYGGGFDVCVALLSVSLTSRMRNENMGTLGYVNLESLHFLSFFYSFIPVFFFFFISNVLTVKLFVNPHIICYYYEIEFEYKSGFVQNGIWSEWLCVCVRVFVSWDAIYVNCIRKYIIYNQRYITFNYNIIARCEINWFLTWLLIDLWYMSALRCTMAWWYIDGILLFSIGKSSMAVIALLCGAIPRLGLWRYKWWIFDLNWTEYDKMWKLLLLFASLCFTFFTINEMTRWWFEANYT